MTVQPTHLHPFRASEVCCTLICSIYLPNSASFVPGFFF